jgi:ABC-2 type transport system permease protein
VRPHRPRLQRLLWTDVLALLAFTTVMMTAAILRFRKRLD